jgi:hypothetical protein
MRKTNYSFAGVFAILVLDVLGSKKCLLFVMLHILKGHIEIAILFICLQRSLLPLQGIFLGSVWGCRDV